MTAVLFDYPKNAAFGRVLPKSKIYEHGSVSSAVRQLFVRQVEQIVWQHKLAPETVNLKPSRAVPEIQIFSIALKGDELKPEVLRCIDLAIPFPIIFELRFDGKVKPLPPLSGRMKRMPASGSSANISMATGHPAIHHASPCRWFSTRGALWSLADAPDAVPGATG